jgi:hypothetical protein
MFVLMEKEDRSLNWYYEDLLRTMDLWNQYLLCRDNMVGLPDISIFFTSPLLGNIPVPNFNHYMTRNMDTDLISSNTICTAYVKFSRFIIVGNIAGGLKGWGGCLISPGDGMINGQRCVSEEVSNYFKARTSKITNICKQKLNNRSKSIIERDLKALGPDLFKKDAGIIALSDRLKSAK